MLLSIFLGTQVFVNTSSTYTDVVYLTYLSDIARVREYNWGAATLTYSYHRLGEGWLWKASTVAGRCTLIVVTILYPSTFSQSLLYIFDNMFDPHVLFFKVRCYNTSQKLLALLARERCRVTLRPC